MLVQNSINQIQIFNKGIVQTPPSIITLSSGSTAILSANLTGILEVVGTAGNVNCTSIAQGSNGQIMTIFGTNDTDTATIKATTTNVKVTTDCILGKNDCVQLIYRTAGSVNSWCEISRTNNPA